MAITKSAKKEIRASKKKQLFNLRRLRTMRDLIKQLKAKKKEGSADEVKNLFIKTQQAIDKATKRGVIKQNTASRKKMRLVKFLKAN